MNDYIIFNVLNLIVLIISLKLSLQYKERVGSVFKNNLLFKCFKECMALTWQLMIILLKYFQSNSMKISNSYTEDVFRLCDLQQIVRNYLTLILFFVSVSSVYRNKRLFFECNECLFKYIYICILFKLLHRNLEAYKSCIAGQFLF